MTTAPQRTGTADDVRAWRATSRRMADAVVEARETAQPTATLDSWKPANVRDAVQFVAWALRSGHADILASAQTWLAWLLQLGATLATLCTPVSEPLPAGHTLAQLRHRTPPPWLRNLAIVTRPVAPRAPAALRLRMA